MNRIILEPPTTAKVEGMRCLVVADVHSNLEAFQAVIEHAESFGRVRAHPVPGRHRGVRAGPGSGPSRCCVRIPTRQFRATMTLRQLAPFLSRRSIRQHGSAALWTRHRLEAEELEYLRSNPLRHQEAQVTLLHGTPREPVWEYFLPWLMTPQDTDECFRLFSTPLCLLGHSHLPFRL